MITTSSTPTHTTGTAQKGDRTAQRNLAERTSKFAYNVRTFVRRTPKTLASMGDCRRLARSSGEIGSSYLQADIAPSREAFLFHITDCCREARQTGHWLHLLSGDLDEKGEQMHAKLVQEASELEKIFGAILYKVRSKKSEQ